MAIKKLSARKQRRLNAVEIMSRWDDAVDYDKTDWSKYDKDCIENRDGLVLRDAKKQPTVFLCNFELSGKDQAKVKNAMITGVNNEDESTQMSLGTWQYKVAALTLKDIRNPPDEKDCIEFKKNGKGEVLESVMDELESAGVVAEIFNHYNQLTRDEVKRNSPN